MKRRSLFPLAGAALLAGCGFELRKAPDFAFDTITINAPPSSPLANELLRNLQAGGNVKATTAVVPSALPPRSTASAVAAMGPNGVILDLVQERREKVVVSLNSTGQVREFQLRSRVNFKLRTPQGKELIPMTELAQQRDISFNEAAVLAKEAEEALLYRDMQTDLVQQLLRRLAALKTL
jgi:LPS-assembly lipoprotein